MNRKAVTERLRLEAPTVVPDAVFAERLAALARASTPTPGLARAGMRVAVATAGAAVLAAGAAYAASTVDEHRDPSPVGPPSHHAPSPEGDDANRGQDSSEAPADRLDRSIDHDTATEDQQPAPEPGEDSEGADGPGESPGGPTDAPTAPGSDDADDDADDDDAAEDDEDDAADDAEDDAEDDAAEDRGPAEGDDPADAEDLADQGDESGEGSTGRSGDQETD